MYCPHEVDHISVISCCFIGHIVVKGYVNGIKIEALANNTNLVKKSVLNKLSQFNVSSNKLCRKTKILMKVPGKQDMIVFVKSGSNDESFDGQPCDLYTSNLISYA